MILELGALWRMSVSRSGHEVDLMFCPTFTPRNIIDPETFVRIVYTDRRTVVGEEDRALVYDVRDRPIVKIDRRASSVYFNHTLITFPVEERTPEYRLLAQTIFPCDCPQDVECFILGTDPQDSRIVLTPIEVDEMNFMRRRMNSSR